MLEIFVMLFVLVLLLLVLLLLLLVLRAGVDLLVPLRGPPRFRRR